ncbi:hypothetical protein KC963_00650 [Candidatus Saccharibacteria bacterium]|nr:hypothetical protein [Candidatus Saccharibacteria bacterium]
MKLFNMGMNAWGDHTQWMRILTEGPVEGYFLMGSRAWCPERATVLSDWDFCALMPQGYCHKHLYSIIEKVWGITGVRRLEPGEYVKQGPMALLDIARVTFFDRYTVDVAIETIEERFLQRKGQHYRLAGADRNEFYGFIEGMWEGFTGSQRYRLACKYVLGENAV